MVSPPKRAHISSDAPTREWRIMSREESPAQLKEKGKTSAHIKAPALVNMREKLDKELSERTLKKLQCRAA